MGERIVYKKLSKTQFIALNALFLAIILLSLAFPLQFGPVSLAILPVLTAIVATAAFGLKNGLVAGSMFGMISFIGSFIAPSLLAQAFRNPIISLLPRILIPVVVYVVINGLNKLFPKLKHPIIFAIGAIAGVVTNTVGVIGFILLFNFGSQFGYLDASVVIGWEWMVTILITNSIAELVACLILTPPITMALKAAMKKGTRVVKD
ncbi:MAG: hypothetical protein LBE09_04995 [Christensenellaceae bacterium]|nr:hypothetical protein [Christensenellaceae bacterium]